MCTSSCSGNEGPEGDPGGVIIGQLATILAVLRPAGRPNRACQARGARIHRVLYFYPAGCGRHRSVHVDGIGRDEVERQVAGRLSKVGWTGPTQAGPETWFDEVDGRQVERALHRSLDQALAVGNDRTCHTASRRSPRFPFSLALVLAPWCDGGLSGWTGDALRRRLRDHEFIPEAGLVRAPWAKDRNGRSP